MVVDALSRQALEERARRVVERLQSEFGSLLASLPLEVRTISEVSRWLRLARPICQRLIGAVRHAGDSLESLTRFPGVRGLHQILKAARDRDCSAALVTAAEAATRQYALLIDQYGGSQRRLLGAIETLQNQAVPQPDADPAEDDQVQTRQEIFAGTRRITGRDFATHLIAVLYRPQDEDPRKVDCVSVVGMIGIRRQPVSLPICAMHSFASLEGGGKTPAPNGPRVEALSGSPVSSETPVNIVAEFSTVPLPEIVAHTEKGRVPVLIDPDREARDPLDIVLGTRVRGSPHPQDETPRVQTVSLVSEGPARDLIMIVYMHRSLSMVSIPTMDSYALGNRGTVGTPIMGPTGPSLYNLPVHRWFDRHLDRPVLESLGVGLERSACPGYPNLPELVGHLFQNEGWDPAEFVGNRCQVRYPLWGAQYLMTFDFGDDEA